MASIQTDGRLWPGTTERGARCKQQPQVLFAVALLDDPFRRRKKCGQLDERWDALDAALVQERSALPLCKTECALASTRSR